MPTLRPTSTALALAGALCALAFPATAPAAVLHFTGKATGLRPGADMRISFDVTSAKGRPDVIRNIKVTGLDYTCESGGPTQRPMSMRGSAHFARSGKFDLIEREEPPLYNNGIWGTFAYPKKGVRAKPTVTGFLSSEFGYGPTRKSYNCFGAEYFKATAAK